MHGVNCITETSEQNVGRIKAIDEIIKDVRKRIVYRQERVERNFKVT